MSKRIASLFLAVLLLFSYALCASANGATDARMEQKEEPPTIQRFSYINFALAGLNIKNGTASCVADMEGYPGTTTKVVIEMTLQKRFMLLFWTDEQTWTQTFNSYTGTLSKTAAVTSGTYRVQATFTVYSGTKSETTTCTSPSLTY